MRYYHSLKRMNPSTLVQEVKMIFSVQLALGLHPSPTRLARDTLLVISHIAPLLSLLKRRKLRTLVVRITPWPNLDPVFTKTCPKRSFSMIETSALG
jgi:hypothetical protein